MLSKLNSLQYNLCMLYILYLLYNIIFQDTFGFIYCDSVVESSFYSEYGSEICFNNNKYNESNSQSNRDMETFSIDSSNVYCINYFFKYNNIIKRRLYWHLVAKGKRFEFYRDFKSYWDPNTKIFNEIKREFDLRKRTFIWIINPRSRGRD